MSYERTEQDQADEYLANEAVEEYNAYLDGLRHEFETRYINVSCSNDMCFESDSGTQKDLESRGWQIGKYSAFCWLHARSGGWAI